jgi:hypothetical protein
MTSRLVAPILFLVTGLVTGYTTFYRMMWAIWGAPIAFVMYVAMCGSGLLVVAFLLMLFNPKIGIRVALLATVLLWCFYLPAALETNWLGVAQERAQGVAAVCSLLLLIVVTAYSVRRYFIPKRTNGS